MHHTSAYFVVLTPRSTDGLLRFTNCDAPLTRDRTNLSANQLSPNHSRNRSHPVRTGGDQHVLTHISNPIHRRDDRSRTSTEELDELAFFGSEFDFGHRDRALANGEVLGEVW